MNKRNLWITGMNEHFEGDGPTTPNKPIKTPAGALSHTIYKLGTDAKPEASHGGKREGSGRNESDTEQITLRLRPQTIEMIKAIAKIRGISYSRCVDDLLNEEKK